MDGKWLQDKLNQNGFTDEDLAEQTGLSLDQIQQVINDQSASQEVWDVILGVLNQYPAVRYPNADILKDIEADIAAYGDQAQVQVYYGVTDNSLVFSEYLCVENGMMHGANVPTEYLSMLTITLEQARTLFTRQNCTIQND